MIQIDFNNGVIQVAPVAGAAATDAVGRLVFGLTFNEWFYVTAIIYSLVMTGLAIHKAVKGDKPKE
ncbi:type II holin [Bacillus subtilis]|nr:type II holin [Pseudomonas sp. A29(2023)]MDL5596021.1 type II holin [Bacillus subtilis]